MITREDPVYGNYCDQSKKQKGKVIKPLDTKRTEQSGIVLRKLSKDLR